MASPGSSQTEVLTTLARSDASSHGLNRDAIYAVILDQTPTEEEIEQFYEKHRNVFGERSIQQSHDVLKQLVRLQKAKSEIGAPDL